MFYVKLMGCTGELDPVCLCLRMGWGGWLRTKKLWGRPSPLSSGLGGGGQGRAVYSGRFWPLMFRKSAKQGCRIWAITLFRLQASYLFARFDMFLSSGQVGGGGVWHGKPIALKCIYLSCRRGREAKTRPRRKRAGSWKCRRESERVGPVKLWVDERTRPPH